MDLCVPASGPKKGQKNMQKGLMSTWGRRFHEMGARALSQDWAHP